MPDFSESWGVMFRRAFSRASLLLAAGAGFFLSSCATDPAMVFHPRAHGEKGETFGYRKWLAEETEPEVVIIGIHGFCGAAIDYANLGNHLLKHQRTTALYAYEVRGQGSDPIQHRRGDIGNPGQWYRDLFAFTKMVRELHPGAKIVWFGESMGALIAAHAWREAPKAPADGLVLSSPIVRFRDDIPQWTPGLVQVAATALPLARISLDTLSGGQDVQMTQTTHHADQVKHNPYHVDKHTLRLIGTLSKLIGTMNDCAASMHSPVLVLHGGKDYFNNDADVRGFVARIPAGTRKTYHDYPQAYHLLMYDAKRDEIFRDVGKWVAGLK